MSKNRMNLENGLSDLEELLVGLSSNSSTEINSHSNGGVEVYSSVDSRVSAISDELISGVPDLGDQR
jgi:hypothetical protein